jgi:hypothetical protein
MSARPYRYPRDPSLSVLVDLAQQLEDDLKARGDLPNAGRAAAARILFVTIALGTRRADR